MAEHVLTRVHSLRECLDSIRAPIVMKSSWFFQSRKPWQRNIEASSTDVKFEAICKEDHSKLHDGAFYEVLKCTQEAMVQPPWVALAIHLRPGVSEYVRVNFNALIVEELSVPEYLHFKEELVDGAFDDEALLRSDLSMKINKPQTQLFCKTLTASDDTSTHGGFSVPRQATEKISPPLRRVRRRSTYLFAEIKKLFDPDATLIRATFDSDEARWYHMLVWLLAREVNL